MMEGKNPLGVNMITGGLASVGDSSKQRRKYREFMAYFSKCIKYRRGRGNILSRSPRKTIKVFKGHMMTL